MNERGPGISVWPPKECTIELGAMAQIKAQRKQGGLHCMWWSWNCLLVDCDFGHTRGQTGFDLMDIFLTELPRHRLGWAIGLFDQNCVLYGDALNALTFAMTNSIASQADPCIATVLIFKHSQYSWREEHNDNRWTVLNFFPGLLNEANANSSVGRTACELRSVEVWVPLECCLECNGIKE